MSVKTRSKRKFKKTSRTGAAAFAIGLYLAGPQVGVAVADGADEASSGSAVGADAAGSASGKAKAGASAGPRAGVSGSAGVERGVLAGRPGAAASQRVTARPLPAAADRVVVSGRDVVVESEASVRGGAGSGAGSAARGVRGGSPNAVQPAAVSGPAMRAAATESGAGVVAPVGDSDLAAVSTMVVPDAGEGEVVSGGVEAGSVAEYFTTTTAAPLSVAAPVASLPEVLAGVDAQINAVAVRVFSGLLNWISTLPVNPVTDMLEGGLLLIRKSLFNQSATVNAVQTANSSELVTGLIDVIDPEGDEWSIEVVAGPSHGTVVLSGSEQSGGIGTTDYSYTPGAGYSGSDSFTIKVSPTGEVNNILDPFGVLTSRYYTVAVGAGAASGNACASCLPKDVLDTTLFLNNAGVAVEVVKQGVLVPRYSATVTLSAFAANQAFSWMDTRGRTGSVSVDQMLVEDWSGFAEKAAQNAAKPLLAFSYSDQGVDKAIFVEVSGVTKNLDGTYEFSGKLMDNVAAQDGRVDAWDFLGIEYKAAYQRYLDGSGLTNCTSGQTCSTVTGLGILAATTLSPSAYVGVGGHDYPLPTAGDSAATQNYPGSMGPVLNAGLDTMLPWGTDGSFIVGESNGVIKLFTANAPTGSAPTWEVRVLKDYGWQSGAYVLAVYNQTVVDANGVPVPVSVTGTAPGGKVITLSLADSINPGTLIGQAITGDGIAPGTVINGFVSNNTGGTITYTVNNAIAAAESITVVTPNIHQQQPGLVVGLADGAVEYWNGGGCTSTVSGCAPDVPAWDGWTELAPIGKQSGWVNSMGGATASDTLNTLIALPNNQGLVAGMSNGSIYLWDSAILASDGTIVPGPNAGAGCSNSSPSDCWTQINPKGINSVDVMIPSGQDGGFIAGFFNGAVKRWDGANWTQLRAGGDPFSVNPVTTLTPFDEATFLGSISGSPVVATNGVISAPSYASSVLAASPVLAASTSGCESSYNSGSGTGCSGYVLTVQSTAGSPLRVGQVLYGGAGLASGTTITEQISDGAGNLCAVSCNAGSTGIYLVDKAQLVAPGTPMSASDGSGFIAGFNDGSVRQWLPGVTSSSFELQGNGWGSAVNTAIGWRDGIVVSLQNGATFYWSHSNNPTGNLSDGNRLNYPGATIPSLAPQARNWSELQGRGWDAAAISMVPIGDGFAVGLSAPNPNRNGAVEMFTGFSSDFSSTSAFGYRPGFYGPEVMPATNKFTEVASQTALSGNAKDGWVQQMMPVTTFVTDDAGNVVRRQSLVAGLANAGIYAWTGSTQDMNQGTWTTLQAPGAGGKPTLYQAQLEEAWLYGSTADPNAAWGAPGGIGAPYVPARGGVPASGDPVFGLPGNQAWCGTNCASYGDYVPILSVDTWGSNDKGKELEKTLFSLGEDISVNFDLKSVTYGYAFYPNSIISKFIPGKYSVGMLVALKGGPSVTLNFPKSKGDARSEENEEYEGPRIGFFEPTVVGTFALDVGFKMGIQAALGVNRPVDNLELAHAYYAPGLLYTWNADSYRKNMSLSASSFADVGYLSPTAIKAVIDSGLPISVTPYITPYSELSYGIFTPKSTPLIGKWSIFDMGLGYQNPVGFTLSAPLNNLKDLKMSVTAQGLITAGVHFLPGITSSLSWDSTLQVYSVTDQTQPPGTLMDQTVRDHTTLAQ